MGTFRQMAGVAADPVVDVAVVRNASPMVHAILALILLLAATVLGVYKPFGMTTYGRRKRDAQRREFPSTTVALPATPTATEGRTRWWTYVFGIIAIGMTLLFLLMHLTSGGLRH